MGIWGPAPFSAQLTGVIAIGLFTLGTSSSGLVRILKQTIGIRVSEDTEDLGQDLLELGLGVGSGHILLLVNYGV